MYDRKEFAKRLRELRTTKGQSQKDFADCVGSTAATISAYENGTKNPSLDVVANIASKHNISLDWLCGSNTADSDKKEINTYSDLFNLFFAIQDNNWIEFQILTAGEITKDKLEASAIVFEEDKVISEFMEDWKKMKTLLDNKTIDTEVYNLWKEKTIAKGRGLIIQDFLRLNSDFTQPQNADE